MKECVGYIKTLLNDRNQIERERLYIEQWARDNEYNIDKIFEAANQEQKQLEQMLLYLDRTGIKTVIFDCLSGASQDEETAFNNLVLYLTNRNVSCWSIRTGNATDWLKPKHPVTLNMLGLLSKVERKRQKRAGSLPEIGGVGRPSYHVKNPLLLAQVKELRGRGFSYQRIAITLEARGMTNSKGKRFNNGQIKRFLETQISEELIGSLNAS